HYAQATLFWESQTAWEKEHIVGGFRFELSKLTVPAIRTRMLASLVNVAPELAQGVALGLGMEVPTGMPRATGRRVKPEVTVSPSLSLTALPGDGGIRTRKIALLVADGVDGAPLLAAWKSLLAAGAVPVFVAPRLGTVATADGVPIEAMATLENSPPVLFDGVVLPDGDEGVAALAAQRQTRPFVADQYLHCKTILAMGAAQRLLDDAGVSALLPAGDDDPGLIVAAASDAKSAIERFAHAVGKHRHPVRDGD
ncbi:MAG: catalase-related domain-containing protein, partial [Betaproteobacteria bacterium]